MTAATRATPAPTAAPRAKTTTGGKPVPPEVTVTDQFIVAESLAGSVTLRVTGYVPEDSNVCVPFSVVAVSPSENDQRYR